MRHIRGFASDNNATVHPDIFDAMRHANVGHAVAYGDDPHTHRAEERFREHFGGGIEVFFVFGGTGANVLCLQAMTSSFNGVICSTVSHVNVDECGAPEKFTGCKLLPIPSSDGKITVEGIKRALHGVGDPHHVQPKVVSITQATEYGTVYFLDEIRTIADYAHGQGMLVHMDGARLANAATCFGMGLRDMTRDAGVDALSFGGTKNGMMYGEAVVLFTASLAKNFAYTRKQGMQLPSKMRFIAAQFEALLSHDLWRKNAAHANAMAYELAACLSGIDRVTITKPVHANAVFAVIPKQVISWLQEEYPFYVWDKDRGEIRLMTSFDTTEDDINDFEQLLKRVVRLV